MSHDLDTTTGTEAIAYVGAAPWHGLGHKLEPDRPLEEWVKAAKLDWQIQMLPVRYHFEGRTHHMSDRFVLARSDTGDALSIVSGDYQVVQPSEVIEFYRDLVSERHYKLETAGALDGGRKVWALARTGLVAHVAGNPVDQIGAYVLLATSCDKSIATTVTFTSIRVVCQNTLGFAFQDMSKQHRRHIKVDHTRLFDPAQIKKSLGLIDSAWSSFLDSLTPLAKYSFNELSARAYFESLFLSDKERQQSKKDLSNSKRLEVDQLLSHFKSARGQDVATAKGTLWGALNAVTYHVDHVRTKHTGDRLDSAWFGVGAALKLKAWERALELVGLSDSAPVPPSIPAAVNRII